MDAMGEPMTQTTNLPDDFEFVIVNPMKGHKATLRVDQKENYETVSFFFAVGDTLEDALNKALERIK